MMIRITEMEKLKSILDSLDGQSVVFLKHSTTCPISVSAYEEITEFAKTEKGQNFLYYVIHVGENRPLSNYLAERYQIQHESPQVFLFQDGQLIWHESHRAITAENLLNQVGNR